jgi:hypothetical protein
MASTTRTGQNFNNLSLLILAAMLGAFMLFVGSLVSASKTTEVFTEKVPVSIQTDYGTEVERLVHNVDVITKPTTYSIFGLFSMIAGLGVLTGSSTMLFNHFFPPTQGEMDRIDREKAAREMFKRVNNPADMYFLTYQDFKTPFQEGIDELRIVESFVAYLEANELQWDEELFQEQEEEPEEIEESIEEPESKKKPQNQLPVSPPATKKNQNKRATTWEQATGNKIASILNDLCFQKGQAYIRFTGEVIESGIAHRFLFQIHSKADVSKLKKFDTTNFLVHLGLIDQSVLMTQLVPLAVDITKKVPGKVLLEDWIEPSMEGLTTKIPIGQGLDGKPIYHDFADNDSYATLLIGIPGSGKTITLQSILFALAALNDPNLLQIELFDFKSLHYLNQRIFPWLRSEVWNAGTDPDNALRGLQQVIAEIEWRELNLQEGNLKKHNLSHPDEPIPAIIVVVDELDETIEKIMTATGDDIRPLITSIVKRGRSLGVWLFCGCQTFNSEIFKQGLRRTVSKISLKTKDGDPDGAIQACGTHDSMHLRGYGHGLIRRIGGSLDQFQSFYSEPSFIQDYLGIDLNPGAEEEEVEFPEENLENNEEQENDY